MPSRAIAAAPVAKVENGPSATVKKSPLGCSARVKLPRLSVQICHTCTLSQPLKSLLAATGGANSGGTGGATWRGLIKIITAPAAAVANEGISSAHGREVPSEPLTGGSAPAAGSGAPAPWEIAFCSRIGARTGVAGAAGTKSPPGPTGGAGTTGAA